MERIKSKTQEARWVENKSQFVLKINEESSQTHNGPFGSAQRPIQAHMHPTVLILDHGQPGLDPSLLHQKLEQAQGATQRPGDPMQPGSRSHRTTVTWRPATAIKISDAQNLCRKLCT